MAASERKDSDRVRYHALLPTPAEANKDKTSFYSDHLPIHTRINLKFKYRDKFEFAGYLNVISWNCQIPNLASGCEVVETPKEAKEREERSLSAIKTMTKENDIIALQEVYFDPDKLQEMVKEAKWEMDPPIDQLKKKPHTVVTLYNPAIIKTSTMEKQELKGVATEFRRTLFETVKGYDVHDRFPNGSTNVTLTNVHLPHEDFPNQCEDLILSTLTQDSLRGNAIILGDFNNRFVKEEKCYQPTNVVPSQFRTDPNIEDDLGIQGADWTDGCFYMTRDAPVCYQATVYPVDPATGMDCDIEVRSSDHFKDKRQREELTRPRPMICCADKYLQDHPVFKELKGNKDLIQPLREIGAYIGYTSDAFGKLNPTIHYPPKQKKKEHLEALKNCMTLLENSKSDRQIKIALICLDTSIDSGIACDAVSGKELKGVEDKLKKAEQEGGAQLKELKKELRQLKDFLMPIYYLKLKIQQL